MSLRLRLVASTLLALILSLGLSTAMAVLRAANAVRTEIGAAMTVGRQTIHNGLDQLAQSSQPELDAAGLLGIFDGSRYLQVTLLGPAGNNLGQSHHMRADPPVPAWFLWLVRPGTPAERIAIPPALGGGVIVLTPEPANEVSEVWVALGNEAVELATSSLLTALLIVWVTSRSLRPLARLSDAFGRIGAGDYAARVPQQGPAEIARLAGGFNRMAAQLARISAQNRQLHEQLLTLQDEERADLARDLHDEIGPFLFSVNLTAAGIDDLAASRRVAEIPAEVAAIREAVAHMQKHVRALLAQLRPVRTVELGLAAAVANVVAFWSSRRPQVAFVTALPDDPERLGEAVQEVLYRVVQEALSNAIRHAAPRRIEVDVHIEGDCAVARVRDDGTVLTAAPGDGFGLAGMRERVAALGGTLLAGPVAGQQGWEVVARLPLAATTVETLAHVL